SRALVTQACARDARAVSKFAVRREESVTENFDALVDLADAETRHDGSRRRAPGSESVTYQDDVDVALERNDVRGCEDTSIGFVGPAFVLVEDGFLRATQRRSRRCEQVRGFADDEDEASPTHGLVR